MRAAAALAAEAMASMSEVALLLGENFDGKKREANREKEQKVRMEAGNKQVAPR